MSPHMTAHVFDDAAGLACTRACICTHITMHIVRCIACSQAASTRPATASVQRTTRLGTILVVAWISCRKMPVELIFEAGDHSLRVFLRQCLGSFSV